MALSTDGYKMINQLDQKKKEKEKCMVYILENYKSHHYLY
jgi:hypothetical protein